MSCSAAGSAVDVSGTSGVLDSRRGINEVALTPVTVGSSAGTVSLTAAEGIALDGSLSANAGADRASAGAAAARRHVARIAQPGDAQRPVGDGFAAVVVPDRRAHDNAWLKACNRS